MKAILEIVSFDVEDIITTSGGLNDGKDGGSGGTGDVYVPNPADLYAQ